MRSAIAIARAATAGRDAAIGREIGGDAVEECRRLGDRLIGEPLDPQPHVLQHILGIVAIAEPRDQQA
jgi:hypothetical protein